MKVAAAVGGIGLLAALRREHPDGALIGVEHLTGNPGYVLARDTLVGVGRRKQQ